MSVRSPAIVAGAIGHAYRVITREYHPVDVDVACPAYSSGQPVAGSLGPAVLLSPHPSVAERDVQHGDLARGVDDPGGVGHAEDKQLGIAADLLDGALAAGGVMRAAVDGQACASDLARSPLPMPLLASSTNAIELSMLPRVSIYGVPEIRVS
jgi:hypothetical protein